MSKISIKPVQHETILVNYMDGAVEIPAHHQWVAVTKLRPQNGGKPTSYLASYEHEPVLLESGHYSAAAGSDFSILCEIEDTDASNSLQRVNTAEKKAAEPEEKELNAGEFLLSTAEVLRDKLTEILEADTDDEGRVHAIYCPEHGLLPYVINKIQPALHEVFSNEDSNENEGQHPIEALLKAILTVAGKTKGQVKTDVSIEELAEMFGAKAIRLS